VSIERYFESEYNHLHKAGEEFRDKHPTLGDKLKITDRQRKDPFVERLLEAFSFLAARIHERLDDDFPEISGGLLEILLPNLLRPFPSCAILQARHRPGIVAKPVIIRRGSEVRTPSGQVKLPYTPALNSEEKERTIEKFELADFIYRTTQELIVRPMRLTAVRVEEAVDNMSALVLVIQPDQNVFYDELDLRRFTLYLQGPQSLQYTLLLYLTRHVSRVEMREISAANPAFQEINPVRVGVAGLSPEWDEEDDERALVPYVNTSFSGYRLLQEYFAFPQRFFFIDIEGLERFQASRDGLPFEIRITFNRKLARERYPSAENLLLHCTPVVNLWDGPAEPVVVTQKMPEYYIIPDKSRRKNREIYSVNQVTGIGSEKGSQYKYTPASSYEVLNAMEPGYDYKRFYTIRRAPAAEKLDMAGTYIRLFGVSMEQEVLQKETLSIMATFSNGKLPAANLQMGKICEPLNIPPGIDVANITVPSEALDTPEHKNYLWALISHLNTSYTSLADLERLKSTLSLYNWTDRYSKANTNRIDGILKILRPETKYITYGRSFIRGIEFRMEVDSSKFEQGEGDLNLFGMVLSRFLSQYATINSVVYLDIFDIKDNRHHTWKPSLGKILPV